MPLFHESGMSVESRAEMTKQVPAHFETDADNDRAALFFSQRNNYVLVLNRANLA